MKNYQHIWFFLKSGETEFFSKNLWIGWSSHGFALSLKTIDFTVYCHIIQPFYILQGTYFNWKKRHLIHTTSKWVEYSAKESLPCNLSKLSWFYALSPVLFYGFCCKRSATMKSIGRHRWPYLISPLLALTGKCCCFSNAFNVDAVIIIGNMMTIVLMEY